MAKHLPPAPKAKRSVGPNLAIGSLTVAGKRVFADLRAKLGRDPSFEDFERRDEILAGGANLGKFDGNTGIEPVLIPGAGKGASPLGRRQEDRGERRRQEALLAEETLSVQEINVPRVQSAGGERAGGPAEAQRGVQPVTRPAAPAEERVRDPRVVRADDVVTGEREDDFRLTLTTLLKNARELASSLRFGPHTRDRPTVAIEDQPEFRTLMEAISDPSLSEQDILAQIRDAPLGEFIREKASRGEFSLQELNLLGLDEPAQLRATLGLEARDEVELTDLAREAGLASQLTVTEEELGTLAQGDLRTDTKAESAFLAGAESLAKAGVDPLTALDPTNPANADAIVILKHLQEREPDKYLPAGVDVAGEPALIQGVQDEAGLKKYKNEINTFLSDVPERPAVENPETLRGYLNGVRRWLSTGLPTPQGLVHMGDIWVMAGTLEPAQGFDVQAGAAFDLAITQRFQPLVALLESESNLIQRRIGVMEDEAREQARWEKALADDDITTLAEAQFELEKVRLENEKLARSDQGFAFLAELMITNPAGFRRAQQSGFLDRFAATFGVDISSINVPDKASDEDFIRLLPPLETLAGLDPATLLRILEDATIESGWTNEEVLSFVERVLGAPGSPTGTRGAATTIARR